MYCMLVCLREMTYFRLYRAILCRARCCYDRSSVRLFCPVRNAYLRSDRPLGLSWWWSHRLEIFKNNFITS